MMNNINISVDFEDKSSVKKALDVFISHMDKYYSLEYKLGKDYINILSLDEEILFYEFLSYKTCEKFYIIDHCVFTDDSISEDDLSIYYSAISQVCLVQKALEYSFEKEVVELANGIVSFVKEVNDYSKLKYQKDIFFGFNLLYTLAFNNPKYTYLMSEYLPDNPSKEMVYFDRCFSRIYDKHGLTKEILYAISYLNYGRLASLSAGGFLHLPFDDLRKFKDINKIYKRLEDDKELSSLLKEYMIENFSKSSLENQGDKHIVQEYFECLLYKESMEDSIKEDINMLIEIYDKSKEDNA